MAGTYRKLKNGKWELCISLGADIMGKRIRKYKYVDASSVREVKKLLAIFFSECDRGYNEGERIDLNTFSKLWLKDYAEKNLRGKTTHRYMALMDRVLFCLGRKKLSDIKPTHLIEFYNILSEDGVRKDGKKGGLAPKTIKHHHALISSMLQTAVDWGIIKENVALRVKSPKVTKKERPVLTMDKLRGLFKALENEELKYRCIVTIALFTGFRRSEIIGLEWKDIHFEERYICVNKTINYTSNLGVYEDETKTPKSNRISYVPEKVMMLIQVYRQWWEEQRMILKNRWVGDDKLFIQWNGQVMHPDTISQWFPVFIRRHKLDYMTFHGLRHEHGSILLAMGMDPMAVADQMGHSSMQMLISTYGHNVSKKNLEVADYMEKAIYDDEEQA